VTKITTIKEKKKRKKEKTDNEIGNMGASKLIESLKTNTSLTKLSLESENKDV